MERIPVCLAQMFAASHGTLNFFFLRNLVKDLVTMMRKKKAEKSRADGVGGTLMIAASASFTHTLSG